MSTSIQKSAVSVRRGLTSLLQAGLSLALGLVTTGCAFVFPVPCGYHTQGSRQNLNEETRRDFQPGKTSLDDVVLALGEPDQIIASPLKLTYEWERVNFHLVSGWAIGLPAPGTGIGNGSHVVYGHRRALVFNFDSTGVLEGVESSDVKTKLDENEASMP